MGFLGQRLDGRDQTVARIERLGLRGAPRSIAGHNAAADWAGRAEPPPSARSANANNGQIFLKQLVYTI